MSDDRRYKNAVIYSLALDSFLDSNGDGTGDFAGLLDRLDYRQGLGVSVVWLMPFHPSPRKDHGYDVANCYGVEPRYGSLGDFVEFAHACHQRGIRVLMDLVINHTSIEHPWFQAAIGDKECGTPVIRYGDEIGMGEDLSLPEREAGRTPMQCSGEIGQGEFAILETEPHILAMAYCHQGRVSFFTHNLADRKVEFVIRMRDDGEDHARALVCLQTSRAVPTGNERDPARGLPRAPRATGRTAWAGAAATRPSPARARPIPPGNSANGVRASATGAMATCSPSAACLRRGRLRLWPTISRPSRVPVGIGNLGKHALEHLVPVPEMVLDRRHHMRGHH